jgi:hypothetical protein
LAVSHFHDRAARELHRQVQSAGQQKKHGKREGNEGNRVEDQRVLHEGNVFSDAEKLHDLYSLFGVFRRGAYAQRTGDTGANNLMAAVL